MDKYREYLASQVLSNGKAVDFRLLSRALKVHVDLAKQMLFEFHRTQNASKPGSVHATYIVCGTKIPPPPPPESPRLTNGVHKHDAEDTVMQSSPLVSSMPEPEQEAEAQAGDVSVTTISLVQEEEFEKTKAQFQLITSVYVHSLQRSRLENINTLSDCTRELQEEYGKEDSTQTWKQYGIIQNPNMKKREGKRPAGVPAPTAASAKVAAKPTASSKAKTDVSKQSEDAVKASINGSGALRTQAGAHANAVSDLSTSKRPAPTLEREKSNLFKAFNKAKEKPKKKEEPSQDTSMDDADEGEDAGDLVPVSNAVADEAHRKARAERAEKLKQMMEDDDEDMTDVPPAEDEPVEEQEEAAPIDAAPIPAAERIESNVEVEGGRRRGRRRVMKKKVTKDAEGYLVTKEEPAWESFSEEEPAPPSKRAKLPSASAPAAKGQAKKGQGSIMNFFGQPKK